MRVESVDPEDPDRERVVVVPDSTEDLWHLQYVVEPGDLVATDIDRRVQRDDDRLRDTGGQRESMWATIRIESVSFDRFAKRLRLGGEIVACSREDQLGHHHTINVEVHDRLELEKRFKPDQRERLREAEAATGEPDVLVVTIEEGRADVFEVAQHGPEHRATISTGSGKRGGESTRSELFAEVAAILEHTEVDAVVLAGPGFAKQDCERYLRDSAPDVATDLRVVDTSTVGERGVQEVLRRGVVDDLRRETRIAAEAELVEDLLTGLRESPALVTYGPAEVARAAEYGAVETFAVVDDRLQRERGGDGSWSIDVDEVIRSVERRGGTVRVVSAAAEPGRQLESLGGIAAVLRYAID
ncbi:MAG: mRNA surveillance protein pelota [Halobacteriales archaeon]